jgi:hypothetical protein
VASEIRVGTRPPAPPNAQAVRVDADAAPEYIGCRTIAYGPVSITRCSVATSMTDDVKVFALKTKKIVTKPSTTRMSPMSTAGNGACDQRKR